MGLVIDTCVFIEAERSKDKRVIDFDRWSSYGDVYISAITISELLIGVHHATKTHRLKRAAFVEAIISHVPALDFTMETARMHAELYAHLAKKGQIIGAHDLIISATALAHGCALLTKNHKEFARIPGLKLLDI